MTQLDPQQLRLDGIYQQRETDRYMQRIKLPAGALSSLQAGLIAELADRFAGGRLHLTSRGSIELHDIAGADLAELNRQLAGAGLTGRGACGGAVRGISCSTSFSEHYPACQALARKLHRHFTGNPWFEGLPKKFKIGIDGDRSRGRQLIQDVGLVYAGVKENETLWDLWCAGGLGREPRAGFLLGERIRQSRIMPLIEGIVRVYRQHTPAGKRLKFLLGEIGEAAFRDLLRAETGPLPEAPAASGMGELLTAAGPEPLVVEVFAGELSGGELARLTELAAAYAGGALQTTADQDLALTPVGPAQAASLAAALSAAGFRLQATDHPALRVCPGSHECRMGLAPTRELAHKLAERFDFQSQGLSLAISGCPNSCSQPQLADLGIVPVKLEKQADGSRLVRYDLYRRSGDGLGTAIATALDENQLFGALAQLQPVAEPALQGG